MGTSTHTTATVGDGGIGRRYAQHEQTREYSPHTLRRRLGTIRYYERAMGHSVLDATRHTIEDFLISGDWSAETRKGYRGDLIRFFRWALVEELVSVDPTATVEPVRVPKRAPTPLNANEVRRLRLAAGSARAEIELGLGAGLRCAESGARRAIDVDMHLMVSAVRGGKGQKDRTVPLADSIVQHIDLNADYVIGAESSSKAVSGRVKRAMRRAGLGHHRPHNLRATFATELARASNGNLSLVANLMGHESLNTTQRYVHYNPLGRDLVNSLHGGLDAA